MQDIIDAGHTKASELLREILKLRSEFYSKATDGVSTTADLEVIHITIEALRERRDELVKFIRKLEEQLHAAHVRAEQWKLDY